MSLNDPPTRSWYAVVFASRGGGGLLLGGKATHTSSRFETFHMAQKFAEQVCSTNEAAGRPANYVIRPSIDFPEIREKEVS